MGCPRGLFWTLLLGSCFGTPHPYLGSAFSNLWIDDRVGDALWGSVSCEALAGDRARACQPANQASFNASTSFVIAARSGSDAIIFKSLRRTPLSRNSLILAIASPRTKLPNSGRKRPSRRASRVQKRFLTAIFFHRGRRTIFQRGDTRSAYGLGRNEPDGPFTTFTTLSIRFGALRGQRISAPPDYRCPRTQNYPRKPAFERPHER